MKIHSQIMAKVQVFRFVGLVALMFFFAVQSCTREQVMTGAGVLKGKISIGPICPVETIPPLPQCLPTRATYQAWSTAVWTSDHRSVIAVIDPNLDGTFHVVVPAGRYLIDFETPRNSGVGGSNLPVAVSVVANDSTNVDIHIDTGIR